MTSEACMLCGENHRFDDSMCYDCDTKQTWPESFIRRGLLVWLFNGR